MGGFYGSLQIRGINRDAVKSAVEKLARKTNARFMLGPKLGEWIGVYPEEHGQDVRMGRDLARKLRAEQLHLIVHDDDFLAYEYHRDGKLVDEYNSRPDYFAPVGPRERQKLRGRPECFSHLLAREEAVAELQRCLAAAEAEPFAYLVLKKFCEVLGIRNAVTSYEYLQEGEVDDIEGWDQFVHIPDLADEKARERQAAAALEKVKQGLIRDGVLYKELAAKPDPSAPWPWFCPAPEPSSFLVVWSSHADSAESLCPLQRCGPPWSEPPRATSWSIDGHVFGMALSPSGRYLAVAHAAGSWKATLWELVENRRIAESPQVRAVTCVGFTPDEMAMVSVSSFDEVGKVVIEPVDGTPSRTLAIKRASRAAIHPEGKKLLIVDDRSRLSVVDMATLNVEQARFVGGRRTVSLIEKQHVVLIKAATDGIDYDEIEKAIREQHELLLSSLDPDQLPPRVASKEEFREKLRQSAAQQLEAMRQQRARLGTPEWQAEHASSAVPVLSLLFDSSGERLCIGTNAGVHVYRWNQIVEAEADWPPPLWLISLESRFVTSRKVSVQQHPSVHTLAFDHDRDWLLFGSLDGRVGYLDLESGRSGVLVEPPGQWPIYNIALSRDLTALALSYQPEYLSTSANRPGPVVQFWNYPALCQKKGAR
jgi:WD40 repeat protein